LEPSFNILRTLNCKLRAIIKEKVAEKNLLIMTPKKTSKFFNIGINREGVQRIHEPC